MKTTLRILFTFCFTAICVASAAENIAVADLTGKTGEDLASSAVITDALRTELSRTGAFSVLERQDMKGILADRGFDKPDCTSDQCLAEMGRSLGVSWIISGFVNKEGETFVVNIQVITVSTGSIEMRENVECRCAIGEVLTTSVPAIARKIAGQLAPSAVSLLPQTSAASKTGSLELESDPTGAQVFLDNSAKGVTPYIAKSLSPGSIALRLVLQGYNPVEDKIVITAGERTERSYTLSHSRAWHDSLRAVERASREAAQTAGARRKARGKVLRVLTGTGTLGCAVVALAYDFWVQSLVQRNRDLKDEYANFKDDSQYNEFQNKMNVNKTDAQNGQFIRNVLYGVSGVCLVGFGVSLAF